MNTTNRSGTILIIVAGISALLASLALTFLVRMRQDVTSSQMILREVQARIMLSAACNYIMETSRMGWDEQVDQAGLPKIIDPRPAPILPSSSSSLLLSTFYHRETYGWIDVRDGQIGPKDKFGQEIVLDRNSPWRNSWINLRNLTRPAARCPMYVMKRPPFAVKPLVAPNPITAPGGTGPYPGKPHANLWLPATEADRWKHLDPQPVIDHNQPQSDFRAAYALGDKSLDIRYQTDAWFRVWRDGPVTFVVTCGAGKTQGFKDWAEVTAAGAESTFFNDHVYFSSLQSEENYLFYLVEWSPHVMANDSWRLNGDNGDSPTTRVEMYVSCPINASQDQGDNGHGTSVSKLFNPVGTIRSIQRLMNEPDNW
jgi:hypothetical protein